ncbi:MAG: PKD domain-containing protein, partial [archaeon]
MKKRLLIALFLIIFLTGTVSAQEWNWSIEIVDSGFSPGEYNSIAIGVDGFPVISYYYWNTRDLRVAKCHNLNCSKKTVTTLEGPDLVGEWSSIAITNNDNLTVVSYYDQVNQTLKLAKCQDENCTSSRIFRMGLFGSGPHSSIATYMHFIVIPSYAASPIHRNLMVTSISCSVPDCSIGTIIGNVEVDDSVDDVGQYTSIAMSSDGRPAISYYDATNKNLKFVKCDDVRCNGVGFPGNVIQTIDSAGDVGIGSSIAIGSDGFPVISYYDLTAGSVKVAKCLTDNCSSFERHTVDTGAGGLGLTTSIAIGSDGFPVISYYDYLNDALKVAKCGNLSCSAVEYIYLLDNNAVNAGWHNSIAIGSDGYPVVSYVVDMAPNSQLRVAKAYLPALPPPPPTFEIQGANWSNMRNTQITNVDYLDTVKLFARGIGFNGKEINFTIKRDDLFWDNKITVVSSLPNSTYSTWRAGEGDPNWDGDDEYYFLAESSGIPTMISDNLHVVEPEDNAPPVAKIETPKIGEIHFLNQPISFTQSSYDEDDELLTEWNFGDGVTNNSYNTTHPYSTTGQKNIKLTVTEALRGGEDSDVTSVLAISSPGKYVFAHIHEPAFWAVFQGQIVYFNASKSYAVEYNASGVFCLAGPCPNQTAGGTNLIDCDLSPCPNGKCSCGLAPMNFSWTFYDGQGNYETSCCSDNNQPASEFELTFGKSGWHRAVLTVGINP